MGGEDESVDQGEDTDPESAKESDETPTDQADDTPTDQGDETPTDQADDDANTDNEPTDEEEDDSNGDESDTDSTRPEGLAIAITTLDQHVTRRRLLGGVGVVVALVLVFLVVFVPSSLLTLVYSSSAEFEAQPATATADGFSAAEYEQVGRDELVVNEHRTVLGQNKTISTTNYVTDYERSINVQRQSFDGAIFTLVSTPAIEVAGRPLNPLADMTHEELLTEFGGELEGDYAGLENLEKVEKHTGMVLGKQTTISQFAMTVEQDGEEITVYLYVADVRSSGDIVVAVGGHPAPFAQERASIFELMAGIKHPSK